MAKLKKDEDVPDTKILYSRSEDGKNWSKPRELTSEWEKGIKTSGGWWSYGDTLVAFICIWPEEVNPKGGYTHYNTSTDGIHWSTPEPIIDADGHPLEGIIESVLINPISIIRFFYLPVLQT